jgi:CDP-6-deoxy-D-xylo-4-hexulose-3-dehydrase
MHVRVPYAMTVHDEAEIAAVVEVLRTSTQMGAKARAFERAIADEYTKQHGVLVNSGSSALFLSMEAFSLPPGSEVITPALTFSTTVGCIVKAGLIPVFVDVEPDTYVIDVSRVESMISPSTRALVIPNLMGNLPDWKALRDLADRHDLIVLEDSADIIGATYHGATMGWYSDVTATSFYGMHIINGAGNGGMVCVNDDDLADRIKILRSWGRSSTRFVDSEDITQRFDCEVDGIPYDAKFVFEEIGYNLEGSELGAAFGLVQHSKLPDNLAMRRAVGNAQAAFFGRYPEWLELPRFTDGVDSVWFAFPMIVKESAPFTRRDVQIFLEERNIQTRVVFTGNVTRQPAFKGVEQRVDPAGLANADRVMERGFLIAAHHGMTDEMLDHTHETFEAFAAKF